MNDNLADVSGLHYDEVVLSDWDKIIDNETFELAEIEEIVPLSQLAKDYISALTKKYPEIFVETAKITKNTNYDNKTIIISDAVKHKVKQQLSASYVKLKKSVVKIDENLTISAKPTGRKTVYDFSLSILNSENKENPINIESQEISNIYELRKTMLQSKYQTVIKRIERRVSLQVKKGNIEVERKKIIQQHPVEQAFPPIESLKSLYSAEITLPKDPYMNIEDIITVSNQEVLKILIIGPSRSGKTTLAFEVCQSLDLHHIELSVIVNALLARSKQEVEEELEEEEKKPEVYNEFEKSVVENLLSGEGVSIEQAILLIENEIQSDFSQSKGFVLDIPLLEPYLTVIQSQKFNFVVHTKFTEEDLELQTKGIKWDPSTNLVYSFWHIAEILKPKPKKEDDEEEAPEDEGPKIAVEKLLECAEDNRAHYSQITQDYFQNIEPVLINYTKDLPESFKLIISSGGLTPSERKDIILGKLGNRINKPPAAKKLEGESNPKSLLMQEVEENQEPRS